MTKGLISHFVGRTSGSFDKKSRIKQQDIFKIMQIEALMIIQIDVIDPQADNPFVGCCRLKKDPLDV